MAGFFRFFVLCATLLQLGCGKTNRADLLHVGLSADYPPFEFTDNGQLAGFDIDLARIIGGAIGKEVKFHDMNFSSILPSLQGNVVDMGISTITATEERSADYAFSDPYFFEELHLISRAKKPLDGYEDLRGRRIACQLGSTMEIWMRRAAPSSAHMVLVDSNVQAIEALKAGLVDGIVVDSFQAKAFCERNAALKHIFLDRSGSGYAVAMRKNSPYLEAVNNTIKDLRESGDLENLCKKWGLQ